MVFDELLEIVKSIEYEAEMGIFSGWSTFRKHLEANKITKTLIAEITVSVAAKREIEKQLWLLVEDVPDPNVISAHDAGITTYLYALNDVDPQLGEAIAHKLESRNDLWWGRYLIKDILHVPVADL